MGTSIMKIYVYKSVRGLQLRKYTELRIYAAVGKSAQKVKEQ